MKSQFPFTDYDFYAYLSAGFLLLVTLDHVWQAGVIFRADWAVVEGVLIVAIAYIVGHLLAGWSSAILEQRLLETWFAKPDQVLFASDAELFGAHAKHAAFRRFFRAVYPAYYKYRLPTKTVALIRKKANARGVAVPSQDLYYLAYNAVRGNEAAMDRFAKFLNLSGMCRNLSFTGFLCTALLLGNVWWRRATIGDVLPELWLAAAVAVLSVGMFLRYLKFFKHQANEVYATLAFSK